MNNRIDRWTQEMRWIDEGLSALGYYISMSAFYIAVAWVIVTIIEAYQ